jgi:hypothetical protein
VPFSYFIVSKSYDGIVGNDMPPRACRTLENGRSMLCIVIGGHRAGSASNGNDEGTTGPRGIGIDRHGRDQHTLRATLLEPGRRRKLTMGAFAKRQALWTCLRQELAASNALGPRRAGRGGLIGLAKIVVCCLRLPRVSRATGGGQADPAPATMAAFPICD